MSSFPRRARVVAVGLGALALFACAQSEPERVTEGALPQETEVPESFAASEPLVAADAVEADDHWITTFGDPRLEALIDEAIANNRELAAAAARVEQAAAAARQAGAALKPSIDLAASSSTGGAMSAGDLGRSYGAGLNLGWELDLWGRIGAASAAATAQFEATEADFLAARHSLTAQTAKSWYFAIEGLLQERYAAEIVTIQKRFLEMVEVRHDAGKVPMQDVLFARSELKAAEDRLRQVRSARQQSVRGLEVLLGRYPKAELELASVLPDVPPSPPPGMPSELLERRPDLRAAERLVAAAFNLRESAKAARLPRVGLTVSGGGVSGGLSDLLGTGGGFWSAGANFMAPVYRGGALQEQVEIETARQEETLATYGALALRAFKEVENALADEVTLADREALLESAAADNEQAMALVESQYEVGKVDILSVLQAQGRVVNSRIAATRIRGDRLGRRIDLHLALGGSF